MARRATVQEIRDSGQREFTLSGLFDGEGEPLTVLARKVHSGERMSLMPPIPASILEGPREDEVDAAGAIVKPGLEKRERAWFDALPQEKKDERQREANDYCHRLIARAVIDPPMTVEDARKLGDAALVLADEIQKFSANAQPAEKTKPTTEAPTAVEDVPA